MQEKKLPELVNKKVDFIVQKRVGVKAVFEPSVYCRERYIEFPRYALLGYFGILAI